ncbi:DUF4386 domain-containing protein [Yimella sp. cx-51]|uniref:DUF4386 domain-containing protein n=1 Tax=Yimella sp. cx-51 TaxID=2770551 RepID=UPI00165E4F00|nr:DUF4386 domain-containing protein [Yimella sp. cx-51]MBC9956873.1 DUF4386 domain-containing protein [Yimella sp. cx-51]QTH39098.1 DUF4386 domain-containing protein [Yimella sp. cx-51]
MDTTNLRHARLAGILYLVTHVTSVGAVAVYGLSLSSLGIRMGVLLEFVLALGCVGTGLLLLPLLRRYGEVRAYGFVFLRAVEAAVILAGALPMLVLAWTWEGGDADATLVGLHSASFLVGQGLIIAVNTLILASLLHASGVVPRALAYLGFAGGGIVLVSDIGQLLGAIPLNGPVAALCAVPIFVFEIWFAITLIIARRFAIAGPLATTKSMDVLPA